MPYVRLALVALLVSGCPGTTAMEGDGGGADGGDGAACACDDGLFCNGTETCVGGSCRAGSAPCTGDCDETVNRCVTTCAVEPDADGDGHDGITCGGTDCDDADPLRSPAQVEICDADDVDEDCDPDTYGARDRDGDGHDDAACCNGPLCGDDCDDARPSTYDGAPETCNAADDDCDGSVDEMLATMAYYPDCDGDGFGDAAATPTSACSTPTGSAGCVGAWLETAGDCDDRRPGIHPGVSDDCNGIDDDCSGTVDDPATADAACEMIFTDARHGSAVCRAGGCALGPCDPGWAYCNRLVFDGCEIDTTSTLAHCGACLRACGAASTCSASTCAGLVSIDAGPAHTCALYSTGTAVCWGRNHDGQLGDGTRMTRTRAVPVLGGISFRSLEAGGLRTETDMGLTDTEHTCGHDDYAAYCWGRGAEGQLGSGGILGSDRPMGVATLPFSTPLDGGPPVILGVSPGGTYTIYSQRRPRYPGPPTWTIFGWGGGVSIPASVMSFSEDVTDIAAGSAHSCLIANGAVYCWGANGAGQLGNPSGSTTTPTLVTSIPTPYRADDVATGGINGYGMPAPTSHLSCARVGGSVYCWGSNSVGQRGIGMGGGPAVTGLTDATTISVGGRHACAVRATGRVVCWGENFYGQLGDGRSGYMTNSAVPVTVMGITDAVDVTCGAEHTCAVLADGSARCWGRNDFGQLGDGTTTNRASPVAVLGI